MAKERSEAERAERKAQKQRAKEQDPKADKKDKKRKTEDAEIDGAKKKKKHQSQDNDSGSDEEAESNNEDSAALTAPVLQFALPLADEKQKHKLLKAIKRGAKHRTLKRGVKEITKATRKTADSGPASSADKAPAIAIIAGDVWPEDVVSHIPVQCEDKNIPYIFIDSRKELGEAGATKRPTSCLLLMRDKPNSKKPADAKSGDEDKETWDETFKSVLKMVNKERAQLSW